jgi:uncharacterized protein (DUF983 family)
VRAAPVPIATALWRGLRKKCPHCGEGPLYLGWAREVGRCPRCGLVYERNPGDTWAFIVITDRIPIALGIVIVYFRLGSAFGDAALYLQFAALFAAFVWTSPNRWGLGIALHYLSRRYWPDPADPLPGNSDEP